MAVYQESFPQATVLPKVHMLEEHVVPWPLKQWRIGFGMMGEQGAESIHAYNSLGRTLWGTPDKVHRLLRTVTRRRWRNAH